MVGCGGVSETCVRLSVWVGNALRLLTVACRCCAAVQTEQEHDIRLKYSYYYGSLKFYWWASNH